MNKTKAVFIVLSCTTPIPPPAGLTPGSPSTLGWDHHVPLHSFPQAPSTFGELGWESCWTLSAGQIKGRKPRTINQGLKSPRKAVLTLALTPVGPEDLRTTAQRMWMALGWPHNRRVTGVSESTTECLACSELGRQHQFGRKGVDSYSQSPDEGLKPNPSGLDFRTSFCPFQRNGRWHQRRLRNPVPGAESADLREGVWGLGRFGLYIQPGCHLKNGACTFL